MRARIQKDDNLDSPMPKAKTEKIETESKVHRVITKNEFKERHSKLDATHLVEKENEFRGFFNLITVFMVFFFFTQQARSLLLEGTLVGLSSAWAMFNRFDLLPAWLFMCASSFSVVLLQKLLLLRIFPRVVNFILRVTVICTFAVVSLLIAHKQNWPVVQTAFYLMELLILLMKMHSYVMTNRDFDKELLQRLQTKTADLKDPIPANAKTISYPQNVTFRNFLDFLIVPTLVYEIEYPRTPKIRWSYLAEKLFTFIGLWAVMHVLVDTYITPVLAASSQMSVFEAVCSLIVPFTIFSIGLFYVVFDIGCNGFAELARFADREFYADWWNSKSWDEFARKWNKPVHEWLLRHIYLESIYTYKLGKHNATFITFLASSIVHEFFMCFTLRLFRPWLFFFQMSQIPLIILLRHPALRNTRFGNHFFWCGLVLGPPLLSILYGREYYLSFQ